VVPASFEEAFEPDEKERLQRGDTFNIESTRSHGAAYEWRGSYN
jgi:hypothetical protein